MKQIKSHWRLVFKTFKKAISVTFKVIISMIKSKLFSIKVEMDLLEQRTKINKMLLDEEYLSKLREKASWLKEIDPDEYMEKIR